MISIRKDNSMKPKQYLRQIRWLNNTVIAQLEQLETLRAMTTNITVKLNADRIQETKAHDKMEKLICKIVDFEKEITDDINKLIDLKREVIRKIDAVQDEDYRLLLTLRYLCFKTWEQIAVEMNFTFQWIHILHQRALIEFEKVHTLDCN